jgi:hypothetical protein
MKTAIQNACAVAAILLACGASTGVGWEPSRTETSAAHMLGELQKFYPAVRSVKPANMTARLIAGHFTHGSGLSGQELYLFSDNTYIYTEWADIMSETVFDQGSWGLTNGFVTLASDKSLPASRRPFDHVYLPIRLKQNSDLFIMSHRWDFSYFTEHAAGNPASMFQTVALRRVYSFYSSTPEDERRMKTKLLEHAWRPESFK